MLSGGGFDSGNLVISNGTISTSTNSGALQVVGGVGIGGAINVGGYVTANNGFYSINTFTGTYSDGIIVDYATGRGRVSVGPDDQLSFYSGGPAGTLLATFSTGTTSIVSGAQSTSTTTGALVVTGGVGIGGNVNIGGLVSINNTLTLGGDLLPTVSDTYSLGSPTKRFKTLYVSSGTLDVGGLLISNTNGYLSAVAIYSTGTTASTSTNSGGLIVAGGAGIGGSLYVGNTSTFQSQVSITSTLASTSTTTGALTIAGGLGVAGNGNIGGTLNVGNSSTFVGQLSINSTIAASSTTTGGLVVAGGAGVGGQLYAGSTLTAGANNANYVQLIGAGTGGNGVIRAGGESTTGLIIGGGGSGNITFNGSTSATPGVATNFQVLNTQQAGNTNYITVAGAASGSGAILGSTGTDASVNIVVTPKGSGSVVVTSAVAATSTNTGALRITGGVGIGGDLVVGGNITAATLTVSYTTVTQTLVTSPDIFTITNTTQSLGTGTGALTVAGGVGIGGNLNIGGTIVGGGVRSSSTSTAPANATVGDIWYDTLTDDIYRYTSDGTNSYWLDITGPTIANAGGGGASFTGGTVSNAVNITSATASTSTNTGALTVTGGAGIGGNLSVGGTLAISNIYETVNVIAGAVNSTPTAYFTPGAVTYYTSNAGANWTQNLTYSSGVTLNSVLAVGQSASIAILAKQGSPAYYMNGTLTIDGSSSNVTVYWQGGSAPSSGYINGIDSYTYAIIKTAATPAYTVLASLAQF